MPASINDCVVGSGAIGMLKRLLGLALLAFALPAMAQSNDDDVDKRMATYLDEYSKRAPAPLSLEVDVDAGKAASERIGIAGGRVSLETDDAVYTLDIPPDTLFYPQEISLRAIKSVGGLGPETTGTLAVSIEPSGLPLSQPAWLEIKPKSPAALAKGFYPFGFSGDGSNAHYGFHIPQPDGAVLVMVPHFSGFGMGLGTVSSQALGQTKLELPPPDSARAKRDAAAIGDAQNGYYGAAIDALAGDQNAQSGDDLTTRIKNMILRASGEESPSKPSKLIKESDCLAIDRMIVTINGMRAGFDKDPSKSKRAGTRPRIEPAQWASIKACAEPPARVCFEKGNPWPLVAYLKALRAYRPDEAEMAEFNKIVAWLEALLSRCAQYKMYISSKSRVPERLATMRVDHSVTIPIRFDVKKAEAGGTDVYVGKDKGAALSVAFDCKVRGATCSTSGLSIDSEAEVSLTLGDLPFDTAAASVPGAGGTKTQRFNPKIRPAFAMLGAQVSAQGMVMPLEFELIYTFWTCNYAKEYQKAENMFQFDGWSPGEYPTLYRLEKAKSAKACGGSRKLELTTEMKLLHEPDGTFEPLP
ncbi:MAG: hypothetical protein ACK50Q_11160 [Labrys sp. (in: a-proteobacteria)]